jgi:hypothetical protein
LRDRGLAALPNAACAQASELRANGVGTCTMSTFRYPDNLASSTVSGYGLPDARLAWFSPGGRCTAGLWGRNLTNKSYVIGVCLIIAQDEINHNEPHPFRGQLRARL